MSNTSWIIPFVLGATLINSPKMENEQDVYFHMIATAVITAIIIAIFVYLYFKE